MFTNIFVTEYKEPIVGKLHTISILLFNVFIIGSFACFNLVNIFKFVFFFLYLKALFIVFYDTVVKFNYINKKFGQYLSIANIFNYTKSEY